MTQNKNILGGVSLRFFGFIFLISFSNCTKLVQINPPTSTITTTEVFADSADAAEAILGIYTSLNSAGSLTLTNGATSIYTGSSSDELVLFSGSAAPTENDIYTNAIQATNGDIPFYFWTPAYKCLYQVNACIEGIKASAGLSTSVQSQLVGEAEFIRAFIDFYLVNLFGNVPLIATSNYKSNALATSVPSTQIYQSMLSDLKDAQSLLPANYSISNGQRIRASKWAATALLARVYLYMQDYSEAETQAAQIIQNTGTFSLDTVNGVFLKNNTEAILQWNMNVSNYPFNCTTEGYNLIPYNSTYPPLYYLSAQLMGAFEPGDKRRIYWLDSTNYSGITYYYPYKYKNGASQSQANAAATEYYTVLRLAEQFLIRAEARAKQNTNLTGAIDDLNAVRIRAGLPTLPYTLLQAQVLQAIAQERRIEFFAEWGHRWLDLKRTGALDSVMAIITPQKIGGRTWSSYQQFYPIPFTELQLDPNLKQNTGY
jgi:hypothetical protein